MICMIHKLDTFPYYGKIQTNILVTGGQYAVAWGKAGNFPAGRLSDKVSGEPGEMFYDIVGLFLCPGVDRRKDL